MHEIKFLAWEKNRKEIIPVYDIDFEIKMINNKSAWRFFDEIELMQYIGKKDKNDKEIYTGYIFDDEDGGYFVVEYSVKEAAFVLVQYNLRMWHNEGGGEEFSNNFERLGEEPISNFYIENMEIVGNIYQNPELINE